MCPTRIVVAAALTGLLFVASAARASLSQVPDLFAAGKWEQARVQAAGDAAGARPGEAHLWRSRLAADPAAALALLQAGLEQKRLGKPVRARLTLEIAELELGRGRPADAMAALSPLLDDGNDVPGAVQVTAARCLVALGRGPRARELLAAVRADDPAYAVSRTLLGDVTLTLGDAAAALRWYDAADAADPGERTRTSTGRCRALLRAGQRDDAEALATRLAADDEGSLALLEIRRLLAEPPPGGASGAAPRPGAAARQAPAPGPSRAEPTVSRREPDAARAADGRYTLQLGAFTDGERAREFLDRYRGRVAGLTVEESRDARGAAVYRLRAGGWTDADAAAAAARELGRRLDLDVIVVDRQATAPQGR